VAAGQEQDLVIRLTPAGSVSGTIRGVTGRPAAGADVRLIRRTYDASGDRLLTTVTTTTADDRGEYRFYWITPGRYYVQAGDERTVDWHTPIEHFDMAARSSSNVVKGDHAATYYPGVREIESAVAVDVRPRSELAGIDVTLEPGKRFSIGGHLLDGRRHSSVLEGRIYLHDAASQYSFGGFSFEGDTYRIDSVRPGVYRIGFSTDEENAAVGSVTVAVIDSDVDVDVTLRPPAAIKGRIVVEGKLASAKLEDFSFTARPVGDVAVSGLFEDVFYARARSRADGTFTLNGLGNTELRLVPHDLPSGFYLEAGRLDGVDVLNAAAPFSRASTLEVVVSSRGGRIEGTVTDGRSSPSADAQVVLVPDARRNRPELFKSAASDDAGRFSITGIAPGDYTLIAWEALELYAWFDPDVLNRFESMGQRIHVAESSSLNIDVHAIPQQASR
jgi:hypothetical protein